MANYLNFFLSFVIADKLVYRMNIIQLTEDLKNTFKLRVNICSNVYFVMGFTILTWNSTGQYVDNVLSGIQKV